MDAAERIKIPVTFSGEKSVSKLAGLYSSVERYTVLSPFLGHIKFYIPSESKSNILAPSVVSCWYLCLDFMLLNP